MDPKRYQRLKDLVDQALELPERERDVFLQQECEDGDLLAQARDLLLHHRSDSEGAAGDSGPPTDLPKMAGQKIGPYQIIEPLGEGGMGVVYLAGQSAPLRRKVALKVIKLGMDTREVIIRFESERQALALMDHQNIAKVYDAGATSEGRPFFVMEFIQGIPLSRYCDEHKLGLQDRLNLFIQVCNGVQHAHQKGIIHRDLKPGNILVTEVEGKPIPKIIDFGVAKATSQHLTTQTLFTQMGQMIGTPEYMSPEQAGPSADDVDTRSDVYSLGVLLYELLTGMLPLEREEIMRAGWERMALLVRNEVPKKPSTRIDTETKLSKGSTKLHTSEARLWIKRIRGDLDWITMKALEKDRDRRYGSAADLAADIGRHLESRAVSAGPPSRLYRMGKFVRRNRAGVVIAAGVLVALVGFAAWQTVQSRIISRERDKAMANERLSHSRAHIDKDPTVAVAYALASLEILDQPAARDVVRKAIGKAPLRNELPRWGQKGNPITVDASPDGRYCAVSWSQTKNPTVGIYNLTDYSQEILQASTDGIVFQVIFNSNGSFVAGNGTGGLHVWRIADGEHVHHLSFTKDYHSSNLFRLRNPDKMVVSGNNTGEPTRWFEVDLNDGSVSEIGYSRGSQVSNIVHIPCMDATGERILDYEAEEIFLQRREDLNSNRAIIVGRHNSLVTSVAIDVSCRTGASVDEEGWIKVWDLTSDPPELIREFKENPGAYHLEFDPHGNRFYSSWGSPTVKVYDLSNDPMRLPVPLLDRSFWAHSGTFLSDRSLITSRNALKCGPVAHWSLNSPVAWKMDLSMIPGRAPFFHLSKDGKVLFLWSGSGKIYASPIADGVMENMEYLGKTQGWNMGAHLAFLVDSSGKRCLTWADETQMLDFQSGITRTLPGVKESFFPRAMSENGRYVVLSDKSKKTGLVLYDLDSMQTVSSLELETDELVEVSFVGDTELLVLDYHCMFRLSFLNPSATVDTLWRGDSSKGGAIFEEGRFILARDREQKVNWVNVEKGTQKFLKTTNKWQMPGMAYHQGLGLVALGGWWKSVDIFEIEGDRSWSLPVPSSENMSYQLVFDPRGRGLLTWHPSQIIAWKLPLDPIFGHLDYSDYMDSLRSLTNVRVVPDNSEPTGFRITNTLELEQ